MCLTSKWRFPKKAKEDIVCYKLFEKFHGNLMTPYRQTIISKKPTMMEGLGSSMSIVEPYIKEAGYIHAYADCRIAIRRAQELSTSKRIVRICIIPKGTKYHIGNKGDICAKKLLITKETCNEIRSSNLA